MKLRFVQSVAILFMFGNIYGQKCFSLYEYGDSIINYETNFKNLFNNWNKDNISNADEFELLSYSLVETISTNKVLSYYKNYFSSDKVLRSLTTKLSVQNKFGRYRECIVEAGHLFQEYEDTTKLTLELKEIMTKAFKKRIKTVVAEEIQIDSSTLYNYNYEYSTVDTIKTISKSIIRKNSITSHIITDSILSKECEDVMTGKKRMDEISVTDRQHLFLEELKSHRLIMQKEFNDKVNLGDVVYVINFRYLDEFYANYVVCSHKTKEVVLDYFFMNINIEIE